VPLKQIIRQLAEHGLEGTSVKGKLIADYEATLVTLLAGLNRDNHAIACDIAVPPEIIRGFGPIKEKNLEKAKAREAEFLDAYRRPAPKATAAE